MNRAFLNAYNRELSLLYERGLLFAEEHPDIAGRLGGLLQDRVDPAIAGLLEGTAFLAARVQLQIDAEFSTFTTELIEQLIPSLLSPTPSVVLLQARPKLSDHDLLEGRRFPAGSYVDAQSLDTATSVACRFRLSAPLDLVPLTLTSARVLRGATELQTLGLEVLPDQAGAIILHLAMPEGAAGRRPGLSALKMDRLIAHLVGDGADVAALHELLFAGLIRISLHWLDAKGRNQIRTLPISALTQIGFAADEQLFPEDQRVFRGYALLREFFTFPAKFMGFHLDGLREALADVDAPEVNILIETDRLPPNYSRIGVHNFALNAVPAINLFVEGCSSIKPDAKRHEYRVVPDPSPASHFEVHRVLETWAHYGNAHAKTPVYPLYGVPMGHTNPRQALFQSTQRQPRKLTPEDRRNAAVKVYPGSDLFLSFYEPADLDSLSRVQRLQLRLLCSNRHLPLLLSSGAGTEFRLNLDVTIPFASLQGPTPPRASILDIARSEPHRSGHGSIHWRLISYLTLNLLGLQDNQRAAPAGDEGAAALREILSLFADLSDAVTERQISALQSMTTRPIVRSVRRQDGYHAARGTEVTLRIDERAFEGSGILPICTVLDRFLADHASVNSFTQLVITTPQRGRVKVFPPRTGQGPLL